MLPSVLLFCSFVLILLALFSCFALFIYPCFGSFLRSNTLNNNTLATVSFRNLNLVGVESHPSSILLVRCYSSFLSSQEHIASSPLYCITSSPWPLLWYCIVFPHIDILLFLLSFSLISLRVKYVNQYILCSNL